MTDNTARDGGGEETDEGSAIKDGKTGPDLGPYFSKCQTRNNIKYTTICCKHWNLVNNNVEYYWDENWNKADAE